MAKSPKTRKLPRSTQSRPTAHFVTGLHTNSIQDLRAFAKKEMSQLVSQPRLADSALQIALTHKDVHLATSLMDAGVCPYHQPRHGSNAFSTAVNVAYAASGDLRRVMEGLVDRMLEMGPQWARSTAAQTLDRSSPDRWCRSLVREIKSQPLSNFHAHSLEHCLEVPEAVKALLDRGAVWGSCASGVDSAIKAMLIASEYPQEVLTSLKHIDESTRPHYCPGSDRLAKQRRFDWEAVLRINPVEKEGWFKAYHEPVMAWAGENLHVDMAYLMLLECAPSASASSSWNYSRSERATTFDTIVRLVNALNPRTKSQSKVAEMIIDMALRVDVASQRPESLRFRVDLEDLAIRMVDVMGFAAPDLSALPIPLDHGRLHSFLMHKRMQEKVRSPPKAPAASICTPVRSRF